MITVVVPTMWKYPPFLDFIKYVSMVDVIKEVILVNNNFDETPDDEVSVSILNHPKIKHFHFGKNIFVNPAWNFGVNQSSTDIVCILNDDLHFDLKLFYKVLELYTPDMGALGLSSGKVEWGQTPITNGNIDFIPFTGQNCIGFGELMFVHKQNWRNIPEELTVGFGDNFIFDYNYFGGKQNYFISNMWHYHKGSTTVSTFASEERQILYNKELEFYNSIKPRLIDRTFY